MAFDRRLAIVAALVLTSLLILGRYLKIEPDQPHQKDEQRFENGDLILLFANKVFSRDNPCEEYPYFEFPFCPPGDLLINRKKSLAELLAGDCLTNTLYEVRFKVGTVQKLLCEKSLTKADVAKFRDALEKKFEYEMSYSNIFLRGMVGRVETSVISKPRYYLVKHIRFYPNFLENQVKDINVVDDFDTAVDITEDAEVKVNFTYSVFWVLKAGSSGPEFSLPVNETSSQEDLRVKEENRSSWMFWPSIVVLWSGLLLLLLLPYFRSYFTRNFHEAVESVREVGYSQPIHDKACKCPRYSSLLGAILGIGIQLLIMVCTFFVLAYNSVMYPYCRRSLIVYVLLTYCLTSVVSGYKATAFHVGFTRLGLKECIFQTGTVYFIPSCCTVFVVNIVSHLKFGISYLPEIGETLVILVVWGIFTGGLLTLGGQIAYFSRKPKVPCATRIIQTEILSKSWFTKPPVQMFLGGLIPFILIFPEMDKIYASLWNQKICGAFDTMLTSLISILTCTMMVAMAFTSYELFKKDYQWWWRSVLRGGSTAIFMFVYGIYFFSRTDIEDPFLLLYLGYNACIFYAFFLILGTIGFYASLFVFHMVINYYQVLEKHE